MGAMQSSPLFVHLSSRVWKNKIMKAGQVLRQARARIEKRECWTKSALARDDKDHSVPFDDPLAVRWCALGSILRSHPDGLPHDALACFYRAGGPNSNDCGDHENALELMDRAIALQTKSTMTLSSRVSERQNHDSELVYQTLYFWKL